MPGFSSAPMSIAPQGVAAPVKTDDPLVTATTSPRLPLSARLWGVDLNEGLPRVLTSEGIEVTPGDLSRVRDFLTVEFPGLGEETLGAAPSAPIVDAKRWYLRTTCDVLELRHAGKTVGVFVGAPEDWSSYYIRVLAILQNYQRPALRRRFTRECVFEPLARHHVERVFADSSPANLSMARAFSEMQFHATGHQLSDRWGPLVRYTKFLDPACEAAFLRRFTSLAAGGGHTNSDGKEGSP